MPRKEYSTLVFAKLTGIPRTTLGRLHDNGVLRINKKLSGKGFYTTGDFYHPEVVKRMNDSNTVVPTSVVEDMTGCSVMVKPKKVAKILPFTPEKKLKKLPSGVITKYLEPLANMNEEAREIWKFTLPDLIEFGTIQKCDLHTLKSYCMTLAQISQMEEELTSFVDADGRINPLVTAIDKYRNSAKNIATTLYITSASRKGLAIPEKMGEDEKAWGKVLSG